MVVHDRVLVPLIAIEGSLHLQSSMGICYDIESKYNCDFNC